MTYEEAKKLLDDFYLDNTPGVKHISLQYAETLILAAGLVAIEKKGEEDAKIIQDSVLYCVANYLARGVGHTYSAIHGVKNNPEALLLISNYAQKRWIDLPPEKVLTMLEIEKLRGTRKPVVIDLFALSEGLNSIIQKIHTIS